jgi:hypothetical protein
MTNPGGRPFVLHVDDQPNDLGAWQEEVDKGTNIELVVIHPDEVTSENLRYASLVLVDFKIEQWPARESAGSLTLQPENGLALLAILQEAALKLARDQPRAFALYTAVIQEVARGLPHQPHIISRAHNLEWIFEKNGGQGNTLAERARKVAALAAAVRALPTPWPGDSPDEAIGALSEWLGLHSGVTWHDAAWRAIRLCRPPLHEFAEYTQGIGVLRWALHRILPYPTFLLDEAHLAARLRVTLESLRSGLDRDSLGGLFSEAEYRGQLQSFLGRRWWRAGIEAKLFELTADAPGDLATLQAALREKVPTLETVPQPRLFPVLDEQFRLKDRLAKQDEVVEIVPDDWPPFADEAWALREDLKDFPELKAIAVEDEES